MRVWLAILGLVLVGCPDEDKNESENQGGAAGRVAVAVADRCRTSCETLAECDGFPLSGCAGDIDCHGWPGEAWREEVANAYLECQRTCPTDPDACSKAAFAAAGTVRAVDTTYAEACEKKRASCSSFQNNICGEETLYEESAVVSARSCLDMPCESVGFCIEKHFK